MASKAEAKRVADFLYWLAWFKLPGNQIEELVDQACQHDYSSVDRPSHQEAVRLASRLLDVED